MTYSVLNSDKLINATADNRFGEFVAEVFDLSAPQIETAAESARADASSSELPPDTLGGSAVSISHAKRMERFAWAQMTAAEIALEETDEWKRFDRLESQWYERTKILEATKLRLTASVGTGCSHHSAPCGQAEHLRQVVADGERQTASD